MGSFKGGERKDGLEGAMRTTQTPHSRKARTVIIDTWANFFILFLPPAIRPRQEIHLFPVLIKYVYFFIVHLFIENIALQSWFYREGSFRFSLCLAQSQDIFLDTCWSLKPKSLWSWNCYWPLSHPSRIIRLLLIAWFSISSLFGF